MSAMLPVASLRSTSLLPTKLPGKSANALDIGSVSTDWPPESVTRAGGRLDALSLGQSTRMVSLSGEVDHLDVESGGACVTARINARGDNDRSLGVGILGYRARLQDGVVHRRRHDYRARPGDERSRLSASAARSGDRDQ